MIADYEGTVYVGPFSQKNTEGYGGIYVSRDKGITWTALVMYKANDDMHMQVIPYGDRLFVNACYGVLVSRDGGASWKYVSSDSVKVLPDFICDIEVAGGKVYVFDCSQVYISDLNMERQYCQEHPAAQNAQFFGPGGSRGAVDHGLSLVKALKDISIRDNVKVGDSTYYLYCELQAYFRVSIEQRLLIHVQM